tara:strand:+ start:155 stop:1270 length:1116 start_codon:yes stop_codon:yes gene_type:complete
MAPDSWINQINRRLDKCRILVETRGQGKISLVATLPKRNDPSQRHRTRIALGLNQSSADRKVVQSLAYRLDEQLQQDTFSWANWTKERIASTSSGGGEVMSFQELVQAIDDRFDAHYPDGKKTGQGIYTAKYKTAINRFKGLHGTADMAAICGVVAAIESPSTRKNVSSIVSVTLDFLKLDWDKKPLHEAGKGYTSSQLSEKDIPSDKKMLAIWDSIPDPRWKWVHGMVMAFGLRPSELLDVEFRRDILDVWTFKTKGEPFLREAWALPDEWIEQLDLKNVQKPATADRRNIARQYSDYMERKKLKYVPLYHLRHAYAIRCLVQGIEVGLAARLMGHSVEMHRKHYQRWINKSHMAKLRELQKDKFKCLSS